MKLKKEKHNLNEEKKLEEQKNENKTSDEKEISEEEIIQEEPVWDEEKKILEDKLKTLEKDIEEYKDRFLRKAAEFENYKRRADNDQLNLLKYAAESLIVKLLPVIDDFERSLVHIKDAKDIESIKDGIKLVYDKLMKMLDEQGVQPIEALGKPFDVHYHEAVMQKKVENVEPHTVVEEFEKGYMYKDRVIRHSKVAVSEDNQEMNDYSENKNDEQSNNAEGEIE